MSTLKNMELDLAAEFPPLPDEAWRAAVEADLKGADFAKKLVWQTDEGLPVQPYYRAGALEGLDYLESAPGEAPWLRGRSAAGNSWTIVQEIATRDAEAANRFARKALDGGAEALCFVSEPVDAGISGVNLQSLDDMRTLIRDLPLFRSAIHFRSQANALPVLANLLAAIKASKADPFDVLGSVDYDPLSVLMTAGEVSGSRDQVFFEVANVLETAAKRIPGFRVLSIQAGQWLEAGGSAVEEIAFSLAAMAEYLGGLKARGLSLESVLPHLQVSFAVGSSYYMEIAKLRAARLLIARLIGAFLEGGAVPHTCIVARTADFNKAIYDPHTNLLRATTEAMAAAIGGADAIVVTPFDRHFRNPDDFSLRLSRNIQLLLRHEAYLDKVADPAAGSYLFENLTDSLAAQAWALFQKVEGMGGFLSAAANGFLRGEITRVAEKKKQAVAARRRTLVGINQYPNAKEQVLPNVDCESSTSEVVGTQRSFQANPEDLLGSIEAAYLEGSVLSDVVTALNHTECMVAQPVSVFRAAEQYELLRLRTERFAAKTGSAPVVFLLKMGDVAMRQARGGFVSNFFGCAGFRLEDNLGFATVEDGVAAALEAKADIVVLCSSDEEYPALAADACPKLKGAMPKCQIVVAGYPKDVLDQLKQSGVDEFVHIRSVALDVLSAFQEKLGFPQAK